MPSSDDNVPAGKLPKTFRAFVGKFPAIGEAHEKVAHAVDQAGPLDRKTCELIKIGISMSDFATARWKPEP